MIQQDEKSRMIEIKNTVLNLEEIENDDVEKVKKNDEKENASVSLDEFITKNKWMAYKDLLGIFKERSENDNNLKKTYSRILIIILVTQLIVMNVIFILKGAGVLDFSDVTFNIFITGTILEVFALVTTIVKYLFSDKLTDLLGNLLKDNNKDKDKEKKGLFVKSWGG